MQFSLKYALALTVGLAVTQSQAEMMPASPLSNDTESSSLAARVLNKQSQSFNSHFSNLNSLSITESSGDKIHRQTIAAKIEVPEDEPSVKKLNTVASNTVRKFTQTGVASWYGRQFHGRKTASGDTFDMNELTAAHRSLPLNCYIRVTNKDNGKSVVVKVNDRGPFHGNRVLDLSYGAAKRIGITSAGTAKVSIERVDGP